MRLLPPPQVFHGDAGIVRVLQHEAAIYPAPESVMGGIEFPLAVDGRQPDVITDLKATIILITPDDEGPSPEGAGKVRLDFSPVDLDVLGDQEYVNHYRIYRDTAQFADLGEKLLVGRAYRDTDPNRSGWQVLDTSVVIDSADPKALAYYYAVTAVDDAGFEGEPSNLVQATRVLGDTDDDQDIDWIDHRMLVRCLDGPDAPMQPGCGSVDTDGNAQVDLRDIAFQQRSFTGPLPS